MPDLGSYSVYVLSAYAAGFLVLGLLTWISLVQARRAKAELDRAEQGRKGTTAHG